MIERKDQYQPVSSCRRLKLGEGKCPIAVLSRIDTKKASELRAAMIFAIEYDIKCGLSELLPSRSWFVTDFLVSIERDLI